MLNPNIYSFSKMQKHLMDKSVNFYKWSLAYNV